MERREKNKGSTREMRRDGTGTYNIGICVLRILLSFTVVTCHFGKIPSFLQPYRVLAVPCFMVISFYFFGVVQNSKERNKNKLARIKKLLIPYLLWPVIYYGLYYACDLLFSLNIPIIPTDIFWQFLFGHSGNVCTALWFQFALIVLNILFMMLFDLYQSQTERLIFFLSVLALIALLLQYSGLNYLVFSKFRFEISYPLGRLTEMIPYAVIGSILGRFQILQKGERWRTEIIVFALMVFWIFDRYGVVNLPAGFGYQGIYSIAVSLCVVFIFWELPCQLLNEKWKNVIKEVSKYSLGIYCSHIAVGNILNRCLTYAGVATNNFADCIYIWVISLLISFIISKVPNRVVKNMVI